MSGAPLFDAAFFRRLERLRIHARGRLPGVHIGERLGLRYGSSQEFLDYRPYSPGDDPRYVDWHVYARLERLVVKLFSDERDLCLHLLVDRSTSMGIGEPSKLAFAARVVAALGYVALARHERLALATFDSTARGGVRPMRGRRQIFGVLETLARLEPGGDTAIGAALSRYAATSRTPGVAVVLSDLLEPTPTYEVGLRALRARGFEPQVVHILADEELDPSHNPALAGDLQLVDCERGPGAGAREITADSRTLRRYRENAARFCDDVAHSCRRLAIPYVQVTTTFPFDDLVHRRLRQRRLLA